MTSHTPSPQTIQVSQKYISKRISPLGLVCLFFLKIEQITWCPKLWMVSAPIVRKFGASSIITFSRKGNIFIRYPARGWSHIPDIQSRLKISNSAWRVKIYSLSYDSMGHTYWNLKIKGKWIFSKNPPENLGTYCDFQWNSIVYRTPGWGRDCLKKNPIITGRPSGIILKYSSIISRVLLLLILKVYIIMGKYAQKRNMMLTLVFVHIFIDISVV